MSINTTHNYSPNFDKKKRNKHEIKFIVFHYTGMKKETDAINRLVSNKSKVSSHYLIKNNGKILNLVPDLYISWHAGVSKWKNYKSINKFSIGVEISNSGHDNIYKKYSKKQIYSIIKLSSYLINKFKIKSKFILGHSDIAPDRKKDPGEKFPWEYLSKKKVGLWHDLDKNNLLKKRNLKLNKKDQLEFIKNLLKIGYAKKDKILRYKYTKNVTTAFQRRFRQKLINGIIDLECLLISRNLVKKFK